MDIVSKICSESNHCVWRSLFLSIIHFPTQTMCILPLCTREVFLIALLNPREYSCFFFLFSVYILDAFTLYPTTSRAKYTHVYPSLVELWVSWGGFSAAIQGRLLLHFSCSHDWEHNLNFTSPQVRCCGSIDGDFEQTSLWFIIFAPIDFFIPPTIPSFNSLLLNST